MVRRAHHQPQPTAIRNDLIGAHRLSFTSVAVPVRVKGGVPPMPVTVKRYVPCFAEELTVTLSVEELPAAGLGLKLPVAPDGRLLMDKVTGELNPPVRVIVTV